MAVKAGLVQSSMKYTTCDFSQSTTAFDLAKTKETFDVFLDAQFNTSHFELSKKVVLEPLLQEAKLHFERFSHQASDIELSVLKENLVTIFSMIENCTHDHLSHFVDVIYQLNKNLEVDSGSVCQEVCIALNEIAIVEADCVKNYIALKKRCLDALINAQSGDEAGVVISADKKSLFIIYYLKSYFLGLILKLQTNH